VWFKFLPRGIGVHQFLQITFCRYHNKEALAEKKIPTLPDDGTLIKAVHPDGKECSWAGLVCKHTCIEHLKEYEKLATVVDLT
jgi:hypothetical protein